MLELWMKMFSNIVFVIGGVAALAGFEDAFVCQSELHDRLVPARVNADLFLLVFG